MKKERIPGLLAIVFITLVLCLAANAYFQAEKYKQSIENTVSLAAFVKKNTTVSIDVLKEQLVNMENIKSVDFVNVEAALKTAIESTPAVNEILVGNENPFSSYFIVKADRISLEGFQKLKNSILAKEPFDSVEFDINALTIKDNLEVFTSFYKSILKIAFICIFAAALIRFFLKLIDDEMELLSSLYLAISGVIAAVCGLGFYSVAIHRLPVFDAVNFSNNYTVFILLGGMFMALLWE